MKIRPVRAELSHADGRRDGRTDRKNLIVAVVILQKGLKSDKYEASCTALRVTGLYS